ncbi:MAG: transposase [Thermoguttaceae bacterium]|jgi:hypothetical protein
MSQSLVKNILHLVYSTKHCQAWIPEDVRDRLYAYQAGIYKQCESPAIVIGGVEDHAHALFFLSKNHALKKIVEEVKKGSSPRAALRSALGWYVRAPTGQNFAPLAIACLLALMSWGLTAPAADYEPGTPGTYLFDAGAARAGPRSAADLHPKAGWTLLPEDELTHKFRGDAVVLNDRLAVVLRAAGTGAEVYGQTATGPKYRVEISPRTLSGRKPTALSSVRIIENGPAAVALTASFAMTDGISCSLKYRITAGQMIVEVRPGRGADRLAVLAEPRYLVIPDFFGHDMVFGPQSVSRRRLRLPAENMLLSLLDAGNAEVMCVWGSNRQEAIALRSAAGPAEIGSCEIESAVDKPIWVACLEGAGLWHEQTAAPWKPPFPAKWRVDFLQGSGEASSSWLGDETRTRESVPPMRPSPAMLVYAMDRSQATPLTTFTPIDILRGTLGVGPCQYILQTEGLASDANPTPDNVMTWIEKQFSRKKEKKAADEIGERLAQMVEHVGQAQARIGRYGRMFAEVDRLCDAAAAGANASRATLTSLARSGFQMAQMHVQPPPTDRARQLADQVLGLIGKNNAAAECERLGASLRALGGEQDRTMAVCRMKARWLRQSAAMLAEDHPADAELAGKVQAKTEEMLRTK